MKLVLDSKLCRALAAIGGRSLFKTVEALASSIGPMQSDGKRIKLKLGSGVLITVKPEKPVIKDGYYTFQEGKVTFSGSEADLEQVRTKLRALAEHRKPRLLQSNLSRYGLDRDYVLGLDKQVSS